MDVISLRLKIQHYHTPKYTYFKQALSVIYKEEGIRGLWSGWGTTIMGAPITASIYFTTYETVKWKVSSTSIYEPMFIK